MAQILINPEGNILFSIQKLLIGCKIFFGSGLEVLLALQDQNRLSRSEKIAGCRMLTHFLEIVQGRATAHLSLLCFLVRKLIHSTEHSGEFFYLLFDDPVDNALGGTECGFVLIQNDFFQLPGRACHDDKACIIAALSINAGCQHAAHAVANDEYSFGVDPGILFQQFCRQDSIVNGFSLDSNLKTFIPQHFESMGKRALVISHGRNSVPGQSLGQILKRGQLADLFIHIACAGTVDKHNSRYRCRYVGRQG